MICERVFVFNSRMLFPLSHGIRTMENQTNANWRKIGPRSRGAKFGIGDNDNVFYCLFVFRQQKLVL